MNHNLANGIKMWKGNGDNTRLLFSLKRLELYIMKEEDIVMEHFNSILFHKSEPANKQHTNQPNPKQCT